MYFLATFSPFAMAGPDLVEAPEARDPHPSDAALVIGIADYFVLPDAPGADRDAQVVRDTLVRTRGVDAERVQLLDAGANRERILEAAAATGRATGSGGTAWLYFAGHGALSEDGTLHLLGADAQPDDAAWLARGVTLDELARSLRSSGGQPVLWLDVGSGPSGRSDATLFGGQPTGTADLAAPKGSIVWSSAPGSDPSVLEGHGAFTYLSVGALRGWADGHGEAPDDGTVTPGEAQGWVAETARSLDLPPPVLLGDTTALAWATGTTADAPLLSANDVRSPEAVDQDGGPVDVADEADDILTDARGSLRRMAVGLGGDVSAQLEEVEVGRVRGRAEDDALAPVLAEHLDGLLPERVTSVRFSAFTSRPPLSARVVTVNVDVEMDGSTDAYLVEGITLPSSPNWPMTAEQIGRKLMDQLATAAAE